MKVSRGILALAAGAIVTGGVSLAQEATEATKVAPMKQLLPNSYGSVQVRHELDRNMQGSKVTNDIPNLSVRPTLGSKFFDDKLDSSFTWIFQKNAGNNQVKKTYLYNVTTFDLLSGTYGSITPYAEIYQANGDSFNEAYLGAEFAAKNSFNTTAGSFTLTGYTLPLWLYTSGTAKDTKTPENDTGLSSEALSLREADTENIDQRDPDIHSYTGVTTSFKPAAVSGLSVAFTTELYRHWDPKYKNVLVDDEVRTELDGYAVNDLIANKFTVGYSLGNGVSIKNQVRQYIDGFYEARRGKDEEAKRWENRIMLNAALF